MIQPISNYYKNSYTNSLLSFKNSDNNVSLEVNKKLLPERRDEAIINYIEKSSKREEKKQTLSYVLLGYCALVVPALFWLSRNKKHNKTFNSSVKQAFSSLKDDSTIPTLENCKTINKSLYKFLQKQIEYSKLSPEEIKNSGNAKPVQKFILTGPPGVGKSFYAKIFAKSLDAEYAEVKYSDINSHWAGETLENLQSLMESIIEKAHYAEDKKIVVVFNELDAFIPNSEGLARGIGRSLTKLEDRNCFLNYLDKIGEKYPNVTIIGTTNLSPKGNGLDGAALSRFKKVMSVDFPKQDCLFEGLKMYLKDIPNSEKFLEDNKDQLNELAKQMTDRKCSFRDLNEVIDNAKNLLLEESTNNKSAEFKVEFLEKALKDIEFTDGEIQAGK